MLIGVSDALEDARACRQSVLVAQAAELIIRRSDPADPTELLLAGEDTTGLFLVTMEAPRTVKQVEFAAMGDGAKGPTGPAEYLKRHWKPDMDLKQAEALARRTAALGSTENVCVDVCIVFRRPPSPVRIRNLIPIDS